ncbi:hypothetical protein MNBD_CHLOROFLEXI01-171 [hydrothermal vent metagenome]|uniref:Glycosyltransferase RgtA/B/C/D-like domain-containing protein n=1 Tax=hydrothermal vent metagenome TaxID=652676 RepID=A0A3B0UJZ3_9ZZZZ
MIAIAKMYFGLILILCFYFAVGVLFVFYTPAWQTPDEPAHYNYIVQVATQGCCPIIEKGDWDSAYLEQLKSNRFNSQLLKNLYTVQYEDHQPPLYYLLATPIFWITNGSLYAVRLFSLLLGSGVVFFSYFIVRVLLPERPWVAVGTALLIAFLPQNIHILASVNNDALAWALIALTLLMVILYLKDKRLGKLSLNASGPLIMGILVGLSFLTKATTYFLVAPVLLAIYLRWKEMRLSTQIASRTEAVKILLQHWMQFLVPSVFLGSLWWIRNLNVYGLPDFMGLQAHEQVVIGQVRTAEYIAQVGWQAYLVDVMKTTFTSFWGQFGWMALPLKGWPILMVKGLLLASVSGWIIWLTRRYRQNIQKQKSFASLQYAGWHILVLTLIFTIAAYIGYNVSFLQLQGRYLYSGLIPIALFLVLGLDIWGAEITRITSHSTYLFHWLAISPLIFLPLLDIYILWRIIIPGLTP